MNKQSHECKHHPMKQYTGITRFSQFIAHRKTAKTYFCCSSCGEFLQIPRVYTHAFLKIGYLLFSVLISIGIFRIKLMYGIESAFSNFLSVCFIYLLMHFLQILVSTAILSFSNWEQASTISETLCLASS